MMEVVQVIQEFSTAGGAERVAWELAQAFGRAGIPNAVVTSMVDGSAGSLTAFRMAGRWIARLPTRGALRYLARLIVYPGFTLAATHRVKALIRDRHDEDIVISHGDCLTGDILVVHAVNAESLAEKKKSGQWRWRLNPLHLWVAARDRVMITGLRSRRYVAVSARVSTELQQHHRVPESRIAVISNGIDTEKFRPDPAMRAEIRARYAIPDEARLLLFVSHEFHRKGLAHLVGAMEKLGETYRLLVIGSDSPAPYRKMASAAVNGRMIFAGRQGNIERFYTAADAFVLPTSYETFSLVCIEAMACAVPVLATPVGGIEDYLKDGVNGYRIRQDADDIVQALNAVFEAPGAHASLSAGARATALGYGWDMIAGRYLDLAREVAAEKATALPA